MAQKYLTMNNFEFYDNNKFLFKSDLVGASWYPLNVSETKYLIVGVSPYKHFEAYVKIVETNSKNGIYFTLEDWEKFLGKEHQFREFIYCDSNQKLEHMNIGETCITSYNIGASKIILFESSNSKVALASTSLMHLFETKHIVQCDLQTFRSKNVNEYFKNFLHDAQIHSGGAQLGCSWNQSFFKNLIDGEKDTFYKKIIYEIIEYFPNCISNYYYNE